MNKQKFPKHNINPHDYFFQKKFWNEMDFALFFWKLGFDSYIFFLTA